MSPHGMSVACDGREWFTADAPVCLRRVLVEDGRWRAQASAARDARLRLGEGPVRVVRGASPDVDLCG
jgi:hypothetical protein